MFNSININKFKNLSLRSKNLAFLKKSLYKRRAKLFCTSCNSKEEMTGQRRFRQRTKLLLGGLRDYFVVWRMEYKVVCIIDGELFALQFLKPSKKPKKCNEPTQNIRRGRKKGTEFSIHKHNVLTCCTYVYSRSQVP